MIPLSERLFFNLFTIRTVIKKHKVFTNKLQININKIIYI